MGIYCEINLYKPENGAFTPGSNINGCIKYAVDEETAFKIITVYLKGKGYLCIKHKHQNQKRYTYHRNNENYVDESIVIHDEEKGQKALPIGCYETEFSFKLPEKVPSSLQYLRRIPRYGIRCYIRYYIGIRFERPGMFQYNKKFKKTITVVSGITPRLPTIPTICGEEKKLTQFFSSKKSIVNLKANIKNSVVNTGGKIEIDYLLENDTNVTVKSVEIKLIEEYTFKSRSCREVTTSTEVKDTESKTGSVSPGATQNNTVVINIPSDKLSLDYSQMVSRDYFVHIEVGLPMPHFNMVLKIPVQIGEVDVQRIKGDSPPSYWEVMAEDAKNDGSDDEDSDDEGKEAPK